MNPRFGLAQRLLWLGVITTALVLGVSGFALRDRLHNAILRSLATSLNERADRISASMRLGDSGHIFQDAGLVPDEFRAIFSGWYWQLEAGNNNKHSRSLWDSSLPLAQAATYSDDPELYRLTGPTGEALLGIRRTLDIGGQTPTLYLFGPADATLDELNDKIRAWEHDDNTRRITGHANTIGQDHHAELPLLAPLPADDFDPGLILHPRVDRSALITVRMVKYSVPAHLIGQRVRVSLRASCVVVFEGRTVLATHPRLGTRGVTRVELDHYLEVLRHKPGAFPGSTALAQAHAAGAFTAAHDAFWAAARKTSGDVAGTQALIDVLLLHRSLPSDAVIAGITLALSVGAISPDVVAVEARRHATTHTPAPASQTRGGTVVNLPPRRPTNPHQVIAHLPEDTRPLPTVTAYDELLCRRQPDPAPAPAETHHHTPTGTP